VDPFVVIIFGGVAGLVIALLLLGWLAPGSGAQQLDWRPTRSVAVEVQNEIDDLDQMLEAANARRRRRGERELTAWPATCARPWRAGRIGWPSWTWRRCSPPPTRAAARRAWPS
jgi:hypothetical protein